MKTYSRRKPIFWKSLCFPSNNCRTTIPKKYLQKETFLERTVQIWIDNSRKGHLICETGNDEVPLHSYDAQMRACHFSLQGITYIFPIGYHGRSLQVEGVKTSVINLSKVSESSRAWATDPHEDRSLQGTFTSMHPNLGSGFLASWGAHRAWRTDMVLFILQKEHKGEKLVFTKTKHYQHWPARLTRPMKLQWIQQQTNTETF